MRTLINNTLVTILLLAFWSTTSKASCSKQLQFDFEYPISQTQEDPNQYFVEDPEDNRFFFIAYLLDGSGIARFTLQSELLENGKLVRSKYIFAAKEFAKAMDHLEGKVTSIMLSWPRPEPGELSSNYQQFQKALASQDVVDPVAAARTTWSGKQCIKHGYDAIIIEPSETGSHESSELIVGFCYKKNSSDYQLMKDQEFPR